MNRYFAKGSVFFLMLVLTIGLAGVQPARAADIIVNDPGDTSHDLGCATTGTGTCSLRDAITYANAHSGADNITFAGDYAITLGAALPAVDDDLSIDGTGHTVSISGNNAVRVLSVNSEKTLELDQITIQAGSSDYGGGIFNFGTLTVAKSTFSGNSADIGGGIFNHGTLTVTDSIFSGNNHAKTYGGGINNNNVMTVTGSTFTGNSSDGDGGGIYNGGDTAAVMNSTFSGNSADYGGGISNGGTLTVDGSTFSGNTAEQNGGGIFSDGELTLTNSTFYNNEATSGDGGGFYNYYTATVTNSTFSGNRANFGGGIYIYQIGTLNLYNTILADSTGAEDCFNNSGTVTGDHNLIETDSGTNPCGTTAPLDDDPDLGVLADNGGPTETMALQSGSPAIDAGNNATCTSKDQRGVARPQDGDGDGLAVCDIGAYELYSPRVYLPLIFR